MRVTKKKQKASAHAGEWTFEVNYFLKSKFLKGTVFLLVVRFLQSLNLHLRMFYFPLALIGMLSCFAIMIAVNALYAFVSVGRSIFNEKNLTGFKACKWLISMACSVLIFCTLKKKNTFWSAIFVTVFCVFQS